MGLSKICRFIKKYGIFLVLLLMSIWAVFAIEIEVLPRIEINRSAKYVNGLNNIFLGLSYSYIVGLIIFIFTVEWPAYRERQRLLSSVIKPKIEKIGTMFEYMMIGFPSKEEILTVDTDDISECERLLRNADWNLKNSLNTYPVGQDKLYQTFFNEFCSVQSFVTQLITCYKSQLSVRQLLLLEEINNAQFMTPLKILIDAGSIIPTNGADFIIDEFIKILREYKELKKTIQY